MVTRLDLFKKEMEHAKELYTQELVDFSKRFDCLGKMTMSEMPDIDTQEYIYSFEKLNGTSEKELDEIYSEIYNHMKEFSKANDIEDFCKSAMIWL